MTDATSRPPNSSILRGRFADDVRQRGRMTVADHRARVVETVPNGRHRGPVRRSRPPTAPGLSALRRWWPGAVAAVGVVIAEVLADVGFTESLRYALVLLIGTTVPGMLLHRALRGRPDTLVADLSLGTATGLIAQLPCWALAAATRTPWLVWSGPAVVIAVFALVPSLRHAWRLDRYPATMPRFLALTALLAYALVMVDVIQEHFVPYALPPAEMLWYPDMYFHLSIAGQLTHHVLPGLPQVAGVPLSYHWFSHANQAAMAMSSGLALPDVLIRLWAPPIAAVMLGLLMTLTRRVTGSFGPAAIAALLIALSPSLKLTPWLYMPPTDTANMPDSPSTSYGTVFTLLLLVPVIDVVRGRNVGRGTWVLIAAAALMCPGAKVSTLPVIICGVALAGLVMRIRRQRIGRVVAILGVLIAAQIALLHVTSGSGAGVVVRPFAVLRSVSFWVVSTGSVGEFAHGPFPAGFGGVVPLVVLVLVAAIFLIKFAWLLPALALRRHAPSDATPWLLAGTGIAALVAMNLLDQDGGSELYFVTAAVPMLVVLASWGLQRYWLEARHYLLAEHLLRFIVVVAGACALVLLAVNRGLALVPASAHVPAAALTIVGLGLLTWWCARFVRRSAMRSARADVRSGLSVAVLLAVSCGLITASLAPWTWELLRRERAPIPPSSAVFPSEYRAADFIRRHAGPDDLVATNVHCLQKVTRPTCNTSAFWVSAFTQRQSLVEGWAYSPDAHAHDGVNGISSRQQPFADPELLALNDGVFSNPTRAGVDRMYALGVRWLYADHQAGPVNRVGSLGTYADLVAQQGRVQVYRLRPATG